MIVSSFDKKGHAIFGKKALPEVEDEILLRLLDTEYEADGGKFNQVENFLALVRLERH